MARTAHSSPGAGSAGAETGARGLKKRQYDRIEEEGGGEEAEEEKLVEMATWPDESDDATVPLIFSGLKAGIGSSSDISDSDVQIPTELEYTAEDAIDHIGFGKYQLLLVVYVGLSWVADAAEMILLSFIGPAAQCEWQLSPGEEGAVSSAVFGGVFLGAYAWGLLADMKGRRIAVLSTALFTSVFGLLSALSPSFWWLLLSRALVGFGLGGAVVVFALAMEFLPVKRRGFWLVFLEFFWTMGSTGEALLAWAIIPNTNWRWLVAISALPFVALIAFFPLIPESPKYLMVKGDVDGAMTVLRQVAKANGQSLPEGKLIPTLPSGGTAVRVSKKSAAGKLKDSKASDQIEVENGGEVEKTPEEEGVEELGAWETIKCLVSREYLRTTLLLWFLYFANSFVYYGLVLLTTQLDVKGGKQHLCDLPTSASSNKSLEATACIDGRPAYDNSQYRDVLISSIAEVPGVIIACFMVEQFGRKVSLASLLIACGAFMLPLIYPLSELVTTALMFGARSCSMGGFSVLWAYAPELYHTAVRSTGVGAANSHGRLGGFVCPYVAVGLIESCQRVLSISAFASISVVAGVTTFFFPGIKVTGSRPEVIRDQPKLFLPQRSMSKSVELQDGLPMEAAAGFRDDVKSETGAATHADMESDDSKCSSFGVLTICESSSILKSRGVTTIEPNT
ncbi:hypothetical protein R1sor_010808 [Riccia sorocarpa]|uniref:Major facilitator superfamily (MFS) profile domain-containing protein n=1 Tax=Riccia sorocarpa TaxID=122646 RepID=A0ABD3I2S1_9MARC